MDPTKSYGDELENGSEAENARPWELIDTGRYRPRRIRGSYRGRELG
jgi:hypothetical protein